MMELAESMSISVIELGSFLFHDHVDILKVVVIVVACIVGSDHGLQ